jgi:hypothetical protein
VKILPLSDYDEVIEGIKQSGRVAKNWLYPPLVRADDPQITLDKRPEIYSLPYLIKPTHFLTIPDSPDAKKRGEFLISLLGMLEGLRLIPDEWIYFYRTAVERHTLSDIVCQPKEIEKVLETAQEFWDNNPKVRRLIFGAIHWFLFSQSYTHEFERFGGQYTVLDTCFRIHCEMKARTSKKSGNANGLHAERPSFLAREYGIPIPPWAIMNGRKKQCELSKLRNEFFHEGCYGEGPDGEPIAIGFAYPKFNVPIDLQLAAFNARLILGIIGIKCRYVRSKVDTRAMHGLDLD